MSRDDSKVIVSELVNNCILPEQDNCSEDGCNIQLDINNSVIFRPDDLSDNKERGDCAVFFPDPQNNESFGRGVPIDSNNSGTYGIDYVAAIELKSTVKKRGKIKSQINGVIDFIANLLNKVSDPIWNINCLCLVVRQSSNVPLRKKPIKFEKHIQGRKKRFRIIGINNNKEISSILSRLDNPGTPI